MRQGAFLETSSDIRHNQISVRERVETKANQWGVSYVYPNNNVREKTIYLAEGWHTGFLRS